jgi:EpsI family protein
VARACSGLNYFITSLVLGVLYAYLNYRGWRKRALCVAGFLVFPVILNILRVYVIVVVSHLTDFRFGPGTEHIVFGRVFFLVVILALFWIGRRWHDHMPEQTAPRGQVPAAVPGFLRWWPVPLAVLVALGAPPFVAQSIAQAREHLADEAAILAVPTARGVWQSESTAAGWRPQYSGAIQEQQVRFRLIDGAPVDVYVGVYGLGATLGSEMISYGNVITDNEFGSLLRDSRRSVTTPSGHSLTVRELIVPDDIGNWLVWQWFVVGDDPVVSPYTAKAMEALAFVTRSSDSERIVTLATPMDDSADMRMRSLIEAYGLCISSGLAVEACRE